jgi:exonuclease VII large subunit
MIKKLFIMVLVFSTLISGIASISLSNQVLAQPSLSLNEGGIGSGLSDAFENTISESRNTTTNLLNQANDALRNTPMNIVNQANDALRNTPMNIVNQANDALRNTISESRDTTTNQLNQAAVEKLKDIYSLTNFVGISMVEGVELNEIAIGDGNVSVTLEYQSLQNNTESDSLPVTVVVTKLPVANLTQLMSLAVDASKTVSNASNSQGSIESLLDQTNLTPDKLNNALKILDLIKNLQAGFASTAFNDLDNSQTVVVQTQGGLDSSLSAAGPHEFVTVLVIPSLDVRPFSLVS